MKWMIASDIHGSAVYCGQMLEAYRREKADRLLLLDMKVKEKYEAPMMEMIEFNREEVVTMSGQGDEIPNENFVDSNDTGWAD